MFVLGFEGYLSSEVRLMMNTTRSILGRLSSFSRGRGRLLASLLIGIRNELVVRMKTDEQQTVNKATFTLQGMRGRDGKDSLCLQLAGINVLRRLQMVV